MSLRCAVCDHVEDDLTRLRTDDICVEAEPCKLRFAARSMRDANGTETVESAALDARAAKLASLELKLAKPRSFREFIGAFAVAKRNMTR